MADSWDPFSVHASWNSHFHFADGRPRRRADCPWTHVRRQRTHRYERSGVRRRRLLVPIGMLAVGATLITFCMTLWLGPLSVRTFRVLEDRLRTGQASFQVAPRVFDERFPRLVLYVNDIDSTRHALERRLPRRDGTQRMSHASLWRRKRL